MGGRRAGDKYIDWDLTADDAAIRSLEVVGCVLVGPLLPAEFKRLSKKWRPSRHTVTVTMQVGSRARLISFSLSLGRQAANIAQSYTSQCNNKTGLQYLILSCWCPPAAIAAAALLWSACHPSLALKTTSASSRPARQKGDTSACRCRWGPGGS